MFIGYPIPPALRWVSSRAVADHPHSFPLWPPKGVRRTQEGFRGGESPGTIKSKLNVQIEGSPGLGRKP